jgi:hypothetical protein
MPIPRNPQRDAAWIPTKSKAKLRGVVWVEHHTTISKQILF